MPQDRTHAWQSYVVTLDARVDRSAVAAQLRADGIGCGHGTWACHLQPVYASKQSCPVSADLFRRSLALPMHAELGREHVERVVDVLHGALRAQARPHHAGHTVAGNVG